MPKIRAVNHNNFADLGALMGSFDLEAYIKSIQEKPADERTKIEQELLNLYGKANKEGTNFCVNQLTGNVKSFARNNPLLVAGGLAAVIILLIKK